MNKNKLYLNISKFINIIVFLILFFIGQTSLFKFGKGDKLIVFGVAFLALILINVVFFGQILAKKQKNGLVEKDKADFTVLACTITGVVAVMTINEFFNVDINKYYLMWGKMADFLIKGLPIVAFAVFMLMQAIILAKIGAKNVWWAVKWIGLMLLWIMSVDLAQGMIELSYLPMFGVMGVIAVVANFVVQMVVRIGKRSGR